MRLHCGQKCSSTGAPAPQLRHSSIDDERTGIGSGVISKLAAGSGRLAVPALRVSACCRLPAAGSHAPKELPQPQVDFAFGLWKTKPCVRSAVS